MDIAQYLGAEVFFAAIELGIPFAGKAIGGVLRKIPGLGTAIDAGFTAIRTAFQKASGRITGSVLDASENMFKNINNLIRGAGDILSNALSPLVKHIMAHFPPYSATWQSYL